MKKRIQIEENGIYMMFEVTEENNVCLLHCNVIPYEEDSIESYKKEKFSCVQLQLSGYNPDEHHGSKHSGSSHGQLLKYVGHTDIRNTFGRKLEIEQQAENIKVISHVQFYDNISVIRTWNEVINTGADEETLEYVSSFALTGCLKEGLKPWNEKGVLHLPHNTWAGEVQWRKYSLPELGLNRVEGTAVAADPLSRQNFSMKRILIVSNGTWGCSEYLPMGSLENTESGLCMTWQIESFSSWQYEISDTLGEIYVLLSGPAENENHWFKKLKSGERFETVKAAVSFEKTFEKTIGELTKYRRIIRRPNKDNEDLPVIFNDYMNCLYGDPTTEKLIPLIDAAAEAGCEYFCIDAGWYADGIWWDEVGEWKPSSVRFPKGIVEPVNHILDKGMIPGLWLEIEVMGIHCPLAEKLPDDWFFMRHGKRVIDHGRYQLDFRNPEVRKYASSVIDRLVLEYKVGYIKMDYNINAGIGTEHASDSAGDGLLNHNRAYIQWLKDIFNRYPDLVIENCSSGGMRMAYPLLEIHSIQSTSDQIDYKKYCSIAAASPTAVTPEQAAVWSYPTTAGDEEETVFNMINSILLRIHQSGHLPNLSKRRFELVKEGIQLYKKIRSEIRESIPTWPTGIPTFDSKWMSYGMRKDHKMYLAVWRAGSECSNFSIPLQEYGQSVKSVQCIYPVDLDCRYRLNTGNSNLSVELDHPYSARLFEITFS